MSERRPRPTARTRGAARRVAALVLAAATVAAAGHAAAKVKPDLEVDGRLRHRTVLLSELPLDAEGTPSGQQAWGTALLRVTPRLTITPEVILQAQLQVLDGQVYGDQTDLGGNAVLRPWKPTPLEDQVRLREAWLQVPIGIGTLRAGRMASSWGLGILANGGDDEAYAFADATHGDIVNRLAVVARVYGRDNHPEHGPALDVIAAGDLVETDELTDRREEGDRAWQGVGAVLWRDGGLRAGAYVAYRHLTRENDATLRATAFDAFAAWGGLVGERWKLLLGGEAVLVMGRTDELRFDGAPEELDVLQGGGVVKAAVQDLGSRFDYGLELGYASGDNAPQDGTLRGLRFDPAYKVGMILFEEVLGRASARGHDRVVDPELSGQPPRGIERSPTQGAITNAAFLYPRVGYTVFEGRLRAQVGTLLAFAPADVVDPYAAAEGGGYNRNPWGKRDARGLYGWEGNAGLDVNTRGRGGITLRVGAQYGVLVPGPALAAGPGAAEVGVVHKARILTDLRW